MNFETKTEQVSAEWERVNFESDERKIVIYDLEFKNEQHKQTVYKTTLIDKDYIGWRYRFPTEGIVVIVNKFDNIMSHVINWNLHQFLEHDDNDFSLDLFLHDPLIQILSWDDLTNRGESVNGGFMVEVLVFDENIKFHDMINCVKHHLSLQKVNLNECKIAENIKNAYLQLLTNSELSRYQANILGNINNIKVDIDKVTKNICDKLSQITNDYDAFYKTLLEPFEIDENLTKDDPVLFSVKTKKICKGVFEKRLRDIIIEDNIIEDINEKQQQESKNKIPLDELDTNMCLYFVKVHDVLYKLEKEMKDQFTDFKKQISKLSNEEREKYKKHMEIMKEMSDHGGERDWQYKVLLGEEFGSHQLGNHRDPKIDCEYCCE